MAKHRFRRLGPDAEAKSLKTWRKALKLKHLSVRTANNKGFKCFQLESWPFLYCLVQENKIERLQLCLLSFDNNLSENDSKKVLGPIESNKNSGFLYP